MSLVLAIWRFFGTRLGGSLLAAVALGLAVWGALGWHEARSETAIETAVTAALSKRDGQWQNAFDTMKGAADKWRENFEGRRDALAAARRQAHEDELRRIGVDADALRLRGPGLAAAGAGCRPEADPRAGATTSGQQSPAAGPYAPRPGLPEGDRDGDFALVPWGWLVRKAEEHDALLSEAGAWRLHDADQRVLLHDARAELLRRLDAARPAFGQLPTEGDGQ